MTNKKYTKQEKEELDTFLLDEFYQNIYNELTNKKSEYFKLIDPLIFIRLFNKQTILIDETKNRPLFNARNLQKVYLDEKQFHYLYKCLLVYFEHEEGSDRQLDVFCLEIWKLQQNLEMDFMLEEYVMHEDGSRPLRFDEILEYTKTLSTDEEKIKYLIIEKTKYEQSSEWIKKRSGLAVGEQCELEINKLKRIAELEANKDVSIVNTDKSNAQLKKHHDLTLDRAVLAISYLLDELSVKCKLSKKKEFMDFITPYSPNTIKTKLENLHDKQERNFIEYEKDLEVISKYFENLGLAKIVEKIKKDLEIN